jgi:hypothetical protein
LGEKELIMAHNENVLNKVFLDLDISTKVNT